MPPILVTLFILALFPIVLSSFGGYFRVKQFGHLDNNHPRIQQAKMEGPGARAIAAQLNAWEALIFYSLVILIAFASGVDLYSLTLPGLVFLVARLLHAVFYIFNLATLRSIAFGIGFFDCIYIFAVAASAN
ncbi:MAG: MAPEG family protein [Pseudomonadales bacterium]